MSKEFSDPLPNGAEVHTHSATDTSAKVIFIDEVRDAESGIVLSGGLHSNTVSLLMSGQPHPLHHQYRYAIREHDGKRRIYHTRQFVRLKVEVETPAAVV